jgi:DNA-binding SARP family transcriptional activator
MRYQILGPLSLQDEGGSRTISTHKVEKLLAALLIRREQVLSTGQLIAEIWRDAPPLRAMEALYVYISQLRKFLKKAGWRNTEIVTRAPGYLLRIGDNEFDFDEFQALSGSARELVRAGHYDRALDACESALGLWRGPALADLAGGPIITGFVTWAEEARVEMIQRSMSVSLNLGRHRELVGTLYSLVNEYPLHEDFYGYLMLALYRCGRRADALKVYGMARQTLMRELGLEPSEYLRQLQHAVLAAEVDDAEVPRLAV